MDVKGLLAAAGDYSRFLDFYGLVRRKITGSQVAILMYHRVSPMRYAWCPNGVNPYNFDKQMKYLSQNYEIISLNKLAEHMRRRRKTELHRKCVAITFDDGYKDNYIYAYPILKKYNIPATIFLTTGYIGTGNLLWWDKVRYLIHHTYLDKLSLKELGKYSLRSEREKNNSSSMIIEQMKTFTEVRKDRIINELLNISGIEIPADLGEEIILSWDEIKEMNNGGITIGAHTVNHRILTNLPLEEARGEIVQSKKDIEKMMGNQVTAFSYPNGDFNADIAKLVSEIGFTCAVTVLPNKLIDPSDSAYGLSRIGMNDNFSKSKVQLCGLWGDLHSWSKLG